MIKNFANEAQQAAFSPSTSESTISHADSGNKVFPKGVMVQTLTPEAGDICVLDGNKKRRYFTLDSYDRTLLPSGWQQVSFVEWRRGRKVKLTKCLGSYKFSKYFMWSITGLTLDGEDHAFSFSVTVSGTVYTASGNYSGATIAEVAASMNTMVKDFDFGGQQYHVYVRGEELILQHDTYASYLKVTATGVTATARVATELAATTAMPRMNGVKTGYGAIVNLDRALIYFRSDLSPTDYNPASDVTSKRQVPLCLPAYLGTSAYQSDHCAALRAQFGEGEEGWISFMESLRVIYPSKQGVFYEPTYGDGYTNTYLLAGQKCEDHDGNEDANYLAFDAVAAFGFDADGLEPGKWYLPTIGEITELKKDITYPAIYQKGVGSVSIAAAKADRISRAIAKLGFTQIGNNSGTWGSSGYSAAYAWHFYGNRGFCYVNLFCSAYHTIASVLCDLPEAD